MADADLMLLNGRIATLDPGNTVVHALAAQDGRIVAVGTDREMEDLRGPATEVIDLAGRTASLTPTAVRGRSFRPGADGLTPHTPQHMVTVSSLPQEA